MSQYEVDVIEKAVQKVLEEEHIRTDVQITVIDGAIYVDEVSIFDIE